MTEAPLDVTDTAGWVAAMRAGESARPDAVFKDPSAERLAGDVGRKEDREPSRRVGNTFVADRRW